MAKEQVEKLSIELAEMNMYNKQLKEKVGGLNEEKEVLSREKGSLLRQLKTRETPVDHSEEFRKEVAELKREVDILRQEKFKSDKEFNQRK